MGALVLSTRSSQVYSYEILHPNLGTIRLKFRRNVIKGFFVVVVLIVFFVWRQLLQTNQRCCNGNQSGT